MASKILFFFGALGVFNALLLSLYLLFLKKNRLQSDYFLGLLLLFFFVRVGVSCFYFFGEVTHTMIKSGLVANLFLGPTLLFFMSAQLQPYKRFVKDYLLLMLITTVGLSFCWILLDFEIWDHKVRFVIHSILTFILLYGALKYRGGLLRLVTSKELVTTVRKATVIYVAIVVICLGFVFSLATSYILGPLIFSIVFYLVTGYFLLDKSDRKSYANKKIDQDQFERINQKLTELMEVAGRYRDPDLSLESLARELHTGRHFLSQLLNDNLQKNFHQYVNEYRIEEACRILTENKSYSIEAIGYEVGFRSKSSFFATFKKLKGITPAKYKAEV